jgi:hypothetical protein
MEAEGNFFIFHGGLSQWYTPEVRAYIASRGYANRPMEITGSTRGKVHKRHRDKLVGDSPELYRGPDARGLSDLGTLVALNYSLASFHPAGSLLRGKWPMGKV